jgi:DNA-binding NtrC family response regulator
VKRLSPSATSRHSTARSRPTDDSGSLPKALALHWVSPRLDLPPAVLLGPRTLFGRGDDCAVQLTGSEVSRHHAEVVRDGPIFIVRDLHSTNGTMVNAQRVDMAALTPGSVIRLGEWVGVAMAWQEDPDSSPAFRELGPGLYGGKRMAAVVELVRRFAATDLPMVLEGETGTGKECVARLVHLWSGRKGTFVALNCATLPESLAEAELFGCEKGAFTGAHQRREGHIRAAHGGTLLLDEVVDLPLSIQAKLLRVLEQRQVVPLGSSVPLPVDARIVAAAQAPLPEAVRQRRFRGDLFARLNCVTIRLPALRERVEDVVPLLCQFLAREGAGSLPRIDARLAEHLCLYGFPYNVRELWQLAKRLQIAHGNVPALRLSHLPDDMRSEPPIAKSSGGPAAPPANRPSDTPSGGRENRDAHDLAELSRALRLHRGHLTRAAADVGISRQRAYRLIRGRSDISLDVLRGDDTVDAESDTEES